MLSAQAFGVEVEFRCCWCCWGCTAKHLQCKQRGGISVRELDLYFPQSVFFKHFLQVHHILEDVTVNSAEDGHVRVLVLKQENISSVIKE